MADSAQFASVARCVVVSTGGWQAEKTLKEVTQEAHQDFPVAQSHKGLYQQLETIFTFLDANINTLAISIVSSCIKTLKFK